MEILTAKNLSYTYPMCSSKALDNISFSVEKGDFICLCGTTGSGKSTLMRLFKPELSINGIRRGDVLYNGTDISDVAPEERVKIGYVMQNPDEQIVCDIVRHELAFGMENLGMDQAKMKLKLAEISAYFGLGPLLDKNVNELSGGQKQLLNLAAVMTTDPDVLILDEPCAQLDPVSASALVNTVTKLNRELGVTVLISEHRLDNVLPFSNKMIALDKGKQIAFGRTADVVRALSEFPALSMSMSAPVRMYQALGLAGSCPMTVNEGGIYLRENFTNEIRSLPDNRASSDAPPAIEFSGVFFRYSREGKDVLKNLSFSVRTGEFFCILGENGCGKSTALLVGAAVNRIQAGKIKIFEKNISKYKNNTLYENCLVYLPQDVRAVFIKNTVREELSECDLPDMDFPFDFSELYSKHPYDLSGGESQMLGIAKALANNPRILLLDEPTKGLDTAAAFKIGEVLTRLVREGLTVVAVTHDTQFASEFADRCAMMFDGEICAVGEPRDFFSSNIYYTTPYSRMSRGFFENAVTLEDVIELYRLNSESRGLAK